MQFKPHPHHFPTTPTRAEFVRQQLAVEIVTGEYQGGARLDETREANRMGVSRTPFREAVRQLGTIGLVENRPHRGAIVTEHAADALFEALADLEAACVRHSHQRMTQANRQELLELARTGGSWLKELHRLSSNAVLSGLAQTLWQPITSCITMDARPFGLAVTQALFDQDCPQAEKDIRAYVMACQLSVRQKALRDANG